MTAVCAKQTAGVDVLLTETAKVPVGGKRPLGMKDSEMSRAAESSMQIRQAPPAGFLAEGRKDQACPP
jgi:hypothetical protein